jgi:hypothetical protein
LNTDEINCKITEIEALRAEARRWRIGAMVTTFIVITAGLLILRMLALDLVGPGPKRDLFLSEVGHGMVREVVPQVKDLAAGTCTEMVPRVKAEFTALQTRTPEVADVFSREILALRANLLKRTENALGASLGVMIRERERNIRAMYPDVTIENVDGLLRALTEEGQQRVNNIVMPLVTPFEDTFLLIMNDCYGIERLEAPTMPNELPAWEVTFMCVNLLQDELRQLDPNRVRTATAVAAAQEAK